MTRMMKVDAGFEPIASALAAQLDQVTVIFERQLASDMSAVNKLCMHVEQYRGKMLRPTLVLLSGFAAAPAPAQEVRSQRSEVSQASLSPHDLRPLTSDLLTEKHRIVAAVVEMIHMATLVHDDVLDEAAVRRRGRTVNDLWGNEMAVILGDYLISNAFHLCSTIGDPAINLALGDVTNTLCEGELVQLHHRDDYSIDEALYLEIVRRKTASLIGECCRLGAMLSGAPERISKAMKNFGIALGIAFQIQDDLLDLIGDQGVVGKSLGKDLDKGKLTLPVIYQLADSEPADRGEALRLIMERDAASLRLLLIESGAVARTAATAKGFVSQAKSELAAAPAGPARDYLGVLAESVASRTW
ncbi:MAG: polyprenyl synthetase family protein [Phycisphaerales bacterium]|nr:polyprenyl synthetase family protein [Phycisphaerales bacterium]